MVVGTVLISNIVLLHRLTKSIFVLLNSSGSCIIKVAECTVVVGMDHSLVSLTDVLPQLLHVKSSLIRTLENISDVL